MRNARLAQNFVAGLIILIGYALLLPAHSYAADKYIFTAPPRETPEAGLRTYGPIAEHLSKVLNKNIVYQHPGNWISYTHNMRHEKYDLVFDGPHFVSWRIKHIQHTPLVRMSGEIVFHYVTSKTNTHVQNADDLIGKRVCGHAPPNMGTLRLYSQFNNPMRLPTLVPKRGWNKIYYAMHEGKCEAAIVPDKIYKAIDPNSQTSKVIFSSSPLPGQAFTASPRFTMEEIAMMKKSLMSQAGQQATARLRQRFGTKKLIDTNKDEFKDTYKLLVHAYGFNLSL